jgi:enamine deaminase RidA (YjgF/YER057c/UK114 family)
MGGIMADIAIFNPDSINTPRGPYSHVAEVGAGAKLVVIAGQVAIDVDGNVVGAGDIQKQAAQVYANLASALGAAGGGWKNVVQLMTFVTRREDIAKLTEFREREFVKFFPDGAYPPNTLLIVSGLATESLLIEIQAIAAV